MRSLVFLLLLAVASAKIFTRCEWARTLKSHGMDGYHGVSLADWVCLTEHVSRYNTRATTSYADGSTGYGIFQVNSRYWCRDGSTSSANGCNIQCSQLLSDDAIAAINCAKRVVRNPEGMTAWSSWVIYCENRDLSIFVAGCGV